MTHSERRTRNTLREDFNPLWYLNRLRNKSRNSRHRARTPGCTRLFPSCLSGFQLREPELSESQRIRRASPSLSDISVNLPHRDPLCPVSGRRAGAGPVIQTTASPTFFYSAARGKRTFCTKAGDIGYFHPFANHCFTSYLTKGISDWHYWNWPNESDLLYSFFINQGRPSLS